MIKSLCIIFFNLIFFTNTADAALTNCPKESLKYEKVLGLHPSSRPLLLYQSPDATPFNAITTDCLSKCTAMDDCLSFVLYYNVSSCFWFKNAQKGFQQMTDFVVDPNTAWFIKTCYNNVENCTKLWTFERIPGATLIGNDTKKIANLMTRTECQQSCLDEEEFECRSAKFRIKPMANENEEIRGVCTLSATDRHESLNSYRVSSFDDEYFENQCANLILNKTDEFCAYEEYDNATLIHNDLIVAGQSKDSCEKLCEETSEFNCRGFSLANGESGKFECRLHSEDTKVHGPKLVYENPNGRYYERAQCINISLTCTETYITVNFAPEVNFKGKMYMDGYSEKPQCLVQGQGFTDLKLKLPVLSSQCGIITAHAPGNRTLVTGTLVLQYNPLIQTQGDRAIRIGCIFGNETTVLVGTGITISSSTGAAILNDTTTSPTVEMRVVDLNSMEEVSNTQIGQELQLSIEIKPADGPFDIWAGHLVAMTEKSDESILLLDDRGCPTNTNIFPAMQKVVTNDTHKLVSNFQAFKFASSPIVRFSVIVEFCTGRCPEPECASGGSNFEDLNRVRREIVTHTLETINGTQIIKVNRSDFEMGSLNRQHLPLEFIMIVRNGAPNSDKLVVSDGQVLVAGYDYLSNEVCLNYSLFIGLIVTWIIIQIIFVICTVFLVRRYKIRYDNVAARESLEQLHKNFGFGSSSNLENRRVHWADNQGFT